MIWKLGKVIIGFIFLLAAICTILSAIQYYYPSIMSRLGYDINDNHKKELVSAKRAIEDFNSWLDNRLGKEEEDEQLIRSDLAGKGVLNGSAYNNILKNRLRDIEVEINNRFIKVVRLKEDLALKYPEKVKSTEYQQLNNNINKARAKIIQIMDQKRYKIMK